MKQYLLTPPSCLGAAQTWDLPLGHLAGQAGPDGRLVLSPLPQTMTGGLVIVGMEGAPRDGDPQPLVRDLLSLCRAHTFAGVVLDVEDAPTPFVSRLIPALERELSRDHRGLFLPESYANFSQTAYLYLSSAISGGNLRKRLEEAVSAYGGERLALSLHRAREDFFLPSPDGCGKPISKEDLRRRIAHLEPSVHFSPDLCTNYFTYMSRETGAHVVLFDDGATLRKKRDIALDVGIGRFFWVFPEVEDLGPDTVR